MIAGCADVDRGALVVCEGIFDAILAGRHFATAAMTGAKLPDAGVPTAWWPRRPGGRSWSALTTTKTAGSAPSASWR